MLTPPKIRVRTYLVRGLNVAGSNSGYGNPYPFFSYGGNPVMMKAKVLQQTTEPRFFFTEERDVVLPDEKDFEVGLMDLVTIGSDQLIGSTHIDLEDRWMTKNFREYMSTTPNTVPMEYRPLEGGRVSKGSLEMWIEMVDV